MMNVLIVEDEKIAAARLESLLLAYNSDIRVLDRLDSVKKSVQWLLSNPHPDLVFMDIQLGDGTSFEIFELVRIDCPVIFITAYNEYALKAFQVNSVDYLLKPLDKEDLYKALQKFKNLFGKAQLFEQVDLSVLKKIISNYETTYKNRFIIKTGEHLKALPVNNIFYFFSREKGTFAQTSDNRRYLLDYSLEQIEEMIDPTLFFRINRQFIISFECITDMISYTNSRIKLVLKCSDDHKEIIVSREKIADFKKWLDK